MRLYVTGSRGFVGQTLQQQVKRDPQWQHFDIVTDPDIDIRDGDALNASLRHFHPDAVLHLAAQSNVPASLANPVETAQINVIGTLNLLDAIERKIPQARLLFVGSSDGYGLVQENQLPLKEEQPLQPRNPYAASKVAAEQFVLERVRRGRINACCTRSFNHTGPGQSARFVIPAIARQLALIRQGAQPPRLLTGDLDITRDFLDVRDVVRAYLHLLVQENATENVYNVCSGVETHLHEAASRMAEIAGLPVEFERDPALLRPAEQRRVCGDAARLRQLGWQPQIPFETTLQEIVNDWMQQVQQERV